MVQLLGSALDLPLEERNALHVAAGFVPPYGDKGLAAEICSRCGRRSISFCGSRSRIRRSSIDGRWDVRIRNQASARLLKPFRDLRDGKQACRQRHARRFSSEGPAAVHGELGRVRRPVDPDPSSRCRARQPGSGTLLDEIMVYPGLSAEWRFPRPFSASSPVMTMHLAKGDYRLAFFSTFTTLAMPRTLCCNRSRSNASFRLTTRPPRRRANWHFDKPRR